MDDPNTTRAPENASPVVERLPNDVIAPFPGPPGPPGPPMMNPIAPPYDPRKPYGVGEWAMSHGVLLRCITAGVGYAAHFVMVTVEREVANKLSKDFRADWAETNPDVPSFIKNKPNIVPEDSRLTLVQGAQVLGSFTANSPYDVTIPVAQADWTESNFDAAAFIQHKPVVEEAAQGGSVVSLVTTGEKFEWNGKQNALTEDQLTALSWASRYMEDAALARYTVTTNTTTDKRYADAPVNVTAKATVTTKFKKDDGREVLVDLASPPTGWSRASQGTYTISVSGLAPTVPRTAFDYTITPDVSSTYQGITVSSKSTEVKTQLIYPAFCGYVTTKNYASFQENGVLNVSSLNLERRTASKTETTSLSNDTGATAYYWILAHKDATVTMSQAGTSILDEILDEATVVKVRSFQSGHTNVILDDYKLYITSNGVGNGRSIDRVNMTINVKTV